MPEYARGGVIGSGTDSTRCRLEIGEYVLSSDGRIFQFDGQALVDTGERADFPAVLERLNEGRKS